MPGEPNQTDMTWLMFAFMTVASWGVYGIFLHKGQVLMADPNNGRYKAFLLVGVAYFLTAVVAPIVVLVVNGSDWEMPAKGMGWSLVAGIVGAIGAFCVLLAFGAGGAPSYVMSIIFAGAPIVNAVVSIAIAKNWSRVPPLFWVGIALAALGGALVTLYKPAPPPKHSPPVTASAPGETR